MAEGFARGNINISAFAPDSDTISTGPRWEKWLKQFETRLRFFKITEAQDQLDALNIYGGDTISDLIDHLPDAQPNPPTEGEEPEVPNVYKKAVNKLNNHFTPISNPLHAEYKFSKLSQNRGESIAQYYVRVKESASKCSFPDTDSRILSHIVLTMNDTKLRRETIAKKYDLKTFLEQASTREDTHKQALDIESNSASDSVRKVHVYSKKKYSSKPQPQPSHFSHDRRHRHPSNHVRSNQATGCPYCGNKNNHDRSLCPASGKECMNCHKKGHFKKVCKSTQTAQTKPKYYNQRHSAAHIQGSDDSSDSAFHINDKQSSSPSPTVKIRINGVKANMEADSCSTANIIDETKLNLLQNKLGENNQITLDPPDTTLYGFAAKEPVPIKGCFTANVESVQTGRKTTAKFIVVEGATKAPALLSFTTSLELGLISINNKISSTPQDYDVEKLINAYPEVFNGLGKHNKIKAKLIVDESVTPVIQKQHKVPYNLAEKAKIEERRLQDIGIIEDVPVNEATTWCTNPVIAPKLNKPDSIRYCSNMRVPNTAIKRPVTEAMTVEDIKFKLSGSTVFSVLDMNEAYHQLEMDNESRHMTTFYGVNGKKRYTRRNYGTISAQDIFDKAMDDTVGDIDGVLHIRDDFIVHGKTQEDHDKSLHSLLQRFKETNLTFGRNKCKFNLEEVEFFGYVFSKDGIKPANSKISALQNMAPPCNVSEVQSLLGMAQYSSRFIPNFSDITAPLRKLTHSSTKWKWDNDENAAFNKLRNALSDKSVLGYYEVDQETELHVDAGPHGLGAIITQNKNGTWTPVACYSRSLTPVEERYSQLEKEALAIRWGCERCYTMLIGSKFTVVTDHMPLLPLFNNANSRPPLRLERWLMYLQQFDFKLVYKPGKSNVADYLSRHPQCLSPHEAQHASRREDVVRHIVQDRVPRAIKLPEIQKETKSDVVLQKLSTCITSGRIRDCKNDPELKPYAKVFTELSVAEDIILRGEQIVVPKTLQDRVINLSHEGHQGIVKSKRLLRSRVWFPGIDRMIEDAVQSCIACQAATHTQHREPLKMTQLPKGPWTNVSIDFCGPFPSGEMALVVIDEYSRYPEVEFVSSTSIRAVAPKLDKIFSTHGIPEVVKSDNGPPFNGKEFTEYAEMKGFHHRKISPLWPEANAQAENFMKTLQKAARTAHTSNLMWKSEVYNFLLNYRATPHSSTNMSPSEVLMNRKIRTKVPQIYKVANAKIDTELRQTDEKSKRIMKTYADKQRNVKPHGFQIGDTVLVKQQKNNKLTTPYSDKPYIIIKIKGSMITAKRIEDEKTITRNSSHFKTIKMTVRGSNDTVVEEFPDIFTTVNNEPERNNEDHGVEDHGVEQRPQRQRRLPQRYRDFELYK